MVAVRDRSGVAQGGSARVQGQVAIVQWEMATVQLQASNSFGSGTVTVKAGSDLVARRSGV